MFQLTVHLEGKSGQETQGRNPEAETAARTMEEHCLPACTQWLTLPSFLYNPVGRTTHSGLGPPTLVVNQEDAPMGLPISQSCAGIFD